MSDLDDELKKLIMENVFDMGTYDVEGLDPESVDKVIPQIHQAFEEAGYVPKSRHWQQEPY